MTGILLYIRYKQFSRQLSGAGIYVLLFLILVVFGIYYVYNLYNNFPKALYLTTLLFAVCIAIHLFRRDKTFVYAHLESPRLQVFMEYFLLVFPFSFPAVFTPNWYCFPALLLLLSALIFVNVSIQKKAYFKNVTAVIPASDFEWISGFRKSFFVLIPLYFLALAFSWYRIVPLFLLWFITTTISAFYQECEPLHILAEPGKKAKEFLKSKLIRHSGYLLLLYVPVILINAVIQKEHWLLYVAFILCQVSLLCFAIVLKYSHYRPCKMLMGNTVILSLVALGAIVPFMLPVPCLTAVFYFRKAQRNLQQYLYD